MCWRSAGPARGASDFCFRSDVPVSLGLSVTAGSVFAGSPRRETPRTLHPCLRSWNGWQHKHRPLSIPAFQGQHWSGVAQRVRPIHRQLTSVMHIDDFRDFSCPNPPAVSPASLHGHERVSTRRLNEKPTAQTSVPSRRLVRGSEQRLLHPEFAAIQRQSDQKLWRSHRGGGERENGSAVDAFFHGARRVRQRRGGRRRRRHGLVKL